MGQGQLGLDSGSFRVFLSHASIDAHVVRDVAAQLERQRLTCFYADRDIPHGHEWLPAIQSALVKCHALVAFVREEFKKSEWTDQEVGFALGRQKQVIAVMMAREWAPYGFFGVYQAIRGWNLTAWEIARQVYNGLWENAENQGALIQILLDTLCESRERPVLRAAGERLRTVKAISRPIRECVTEALRSNPVLESDRQLRRLLRPLELERNDG